MSDMESLTMEQVATAGEVSSRDAIWAVSVAALGMSFLVALAVILPRLQHTPTHHQVLEALLACKNAESKMQEYGTSQADLHAIGTACRDLKDKANTRAQATDGAERTQMQFMALIGRDVTQMSDDILDGADPNAEAARFLPELQRAEQGSMALGVSGQ